MQFDNLGWLDEAIEIDYLNKSMDRQGYAPTHIVLHSTAGGTRAEDIATYFATSPVQASAHFVIGQDGHIVQGVNCNAAAWGNGILDNPRLPFNPAINPNFYTISIEHCKPSLDNSDALTPAQQVSSFRLVQAICEEYHIPKKRGDVSGGIVEHADFDSVTRARCPGLYPWDELLTFLKGTQPMAPLGWKDNPQTGILTAPNGVPVTLGFRDYILNYAGGWDKNNTPMAPAEARKQLERGNPGLEGGTRQLFKGTHGYPALLEWTQDRGVFPAYAGQELYAVEQLLAQYTTAANITQVAQALNALIALAAQIKNDGDTLTTAAQTALKALGQ